ncbi:MAG: hypothetical protein U5P41_08310 [Gammaproteobacteria bacterium]|nr:hypothetical protein [Gammaproteobacteria bacterium]
MPVETLQRLALELDTTDITQLVQRDGELAIVELPEPLSPGKYRLRLVEYGDDGSIMERGVWMLEIRKSSAFREYQLSADLAGSAQQLVDDGAINRTGDRLTMQGGANVRGAAADGNWEVHGRANSIYDSELSRTIDGRNLDLGEYQLTGIYHLEDIDASVTAGHQQVGSNNLIMSDFQRRGMSASVSSPDSGGEITAFALRADPVAGVPHLSGVGEPDTRLEGFAGTAPVPGLEEHVNVSGTFYTGQGRDSGFALGSTEDETTGRGWSVAADSLWLQRRLRLRGEYASSTIDYDGDGSFSAENDHGYKVLASYSPYRNEPLMNTPMSWKLGVQHERIGTFFASLANPSLVPDRESTSLFTDLFWGDFSLQAQAGHQTDNVEDLSTLPRHRILNGSINANYSPTVQYDDAGGLPWYGQPSLNVSANYTEIEQIDTPPAFLGFETDNRTRNMTLALGSSYQQWNWNLSHTVSTFDDDNNLSSDTRSNLSNLTVYWYPHRRINLNAYIQWDHFIDRTFDVITDTYNAGMGTTITWIRNRLISNVSYSLNRASGFNDSPNVHNVTGETLWYFTPPGSRNLRAAVSLSGSYQNDAFGPNDSIYQVFVGIKISSRIAK